VQGWIMPFVGERSPSMMVAGRRGGGITVRVASRSTGLEAIPAYVAGYVRGAMAALCRVKVQLAEPVGKSEQ
jgi:hypothetical protein